MIYIILVSLLLCCFGYIINKEISTKEFIILCFTTVLVSLGAFLFTCIKFPNDVYYASGKLIEVQYLPAFIERYTYVVPVKVGKTTTMQTRVGFDYHRERWVAIDSLNQFNDITKSEYEQIAKDFKDNEHVKKNSRLNHCNGVCISGDSNLYYYENKINTYKYSTTLMLPWHNPIKKRQSLFNTEAKYKEYPKRYDWFLNDRLLAQNGVITKNDLDIFNTKLYELNKSNVIIIKVKDIDDLNKTKLAWTNGKKNDIIIAFTGNIEKPTNVKVFGWYAEEILSTALETEILDNGINLDRLFIIIIKYYKPFNFEQFSYLKQPTAMQYIITIILTLLCMIGLYWYFCNEDIK